MTQKSNFLYEYDIERTEGEHPETGLPMTTTVRVPRNLPALNVDEVWGTQAKLAEALGLVAGRKTRVINEKGTMARDVFLSKVRGDGTWRWKKIGTLFYGVRFDTETEEPKPWHSFQLFNPEAAQAAQATQAQAPQAAQPTEAELAEKAEAEAVALEKAQAEAAAEVESA